MSGLLIGSLILWLIIAIILIVVFVYVVNRLYRRSSKEVAFVRTGFLGERVVIDGGAFVLPFIHDFTPVNMNVLPMAIVREKSDALIRPMRLLHARHADGGQGADRPQPLAFAAGGGRSDFRQYLSLYRLRTYYMSDSLCRRGRRRQARLKGPPMLELRKDIFADERDDNLKEIGKPTQRQDMLGHVTATSTYFSDHKLQGMLHLKVLRSPHSHARLRRIDVAEAERQPGVRRIIRGADVRSEWRAGMVRLAACPNVVSKLSGLGTFLHRNDPAHIAGVVRETVSIFGADRCLFGSNFPIEKLWTRYDALADAYRKAAEALPPEQQRAILHDTAMRVYRITS